MFAFLLFFVFIPAIFVIFGIINILAYIYKWEIIMFMNQSIINPLVVSFGKKFVDDEKNARKDCLMYGIILTTMGVVALFAGAIIYFS